MRSGTLYPILLLSIPLLAGIILSSSIGFFADDFYAAETLNWQIQSRGQDMIDLFVVAPVLAISAVLAYQGNKNALLIWAGANLYLVYTFAIFCFAVHFNTLFLVYCMNLGLSFYSMLYFIRRMVKMEKTGPGSSAFIKIISVYFLVISILFLGLWISEISSWMKELPMPGTLKEIGLLTNPVHVIDLSVFLPGVFVTGILLWKNKAVGIMLAPVLLTFFVLMNLTIAALNFMMHEIIPGTNPAITWVMVVLALLSIILLVLFIRYSNNPTYRLHVAT